MEVEQMYDYKDFCEACENKGVHMTKDMFWNAVKNDRIATVSFNKTNYVKHSELIRILNEGLS